MLTKRLLTAIILVPAAIGLVAVGGWLYAVMVTLALSGAAWEYWRIFRAGGFCPSAPVLIGGVATLVLSRMALDLSTSLAILALLVLLSMAVHIIGYERGQERAATDFAIDLSGVLYLGLVGGYLITLRLLPEGKWLVLLALPAVWFADTAAYAVGRRVGRHKMAPRVSPGKSWEGYLAGILFSTPVTGLLALVWSLASPGLTFGHGMMLGFVLSVLTPLGDLGESMIKRQSGVKDSSSLVPGHGGILDRLDSLLWSAVISYYMIIWLW